MLGGGDGSFLPQLRFAAGVHPDRLTVEDFNRDGRDDLLVLDSDAQQVTVLLGFGDGTFRDQGADVPRFDAASDDAARRFIALVDEFYDRNVKLVISAAASPAELYGGERLSFEFERTRSRLVEMQSHDYLARPHKG